MSDLHHRVLLLLQARISPLNARSVLQKAIDRAGLKEPLAKDQMSALATALGPGTRLFLGDEADDVVAAVAALGDGVRGIVKCDVLVEADISLARRAAQNECVHLGANGFTTQRVITMVSELARNIVSYSKGGTIEVVPAKGRLGIVAEDRGPGINNLEEILGGTYKSKTGLGKGLLGVKRLSTSFNISTGPDGTRVVAEVAL